MTSTPSTIAALTSSFSTLQIEDNLFTRLCNNTLQIPDDTYYQTLVQGLQKALNTLCAEELFLAILCLSTARSRAIKSDKNIVLIDLICQIIPHFSLNPTYPAFLSSPAICQELVQELKAKESSPRFLQICQRHLQNSLRCQTKDKQTSTNRFLDLHRLCEMLSTFVQKDAELQNRALELFQNWAKTSHLRIKELMYLSLALDLLVKPRGDRHPQEFSIWRSSSESYYFLLKSLNCFDTSNLAWQFLERFTYIIYPPKPESSFPYQWILRIDNAILGALMDHLERNPVDTANLFSIVLLLLEASHLSPAVRVEKALFLLKSYYQTSLPLQHLTMLLEELIAIKEECDIGPMITYLTKEKQYHSLIHSSGPLEPLSEKIVSQISLISTSSAKTHCQTRLLNAYIASLPIIQSDFTALKQRNQNSLERNIGPNLRTMHKYITEKNKLTLEITRLYNLLPQEVQLSMREKINTLSKYRCSTWENELEIHLDLSTDLNVEEK